MKIVFDKSFLKSIKKIKDSEIKRRLEVVITEIEEARALKRLQMSKRCKVLTAFTDFGLATIALVLSLKQKIKLDLSWFLTGEIYMMNFHELR